MLALLLLACTAKTADTAAPEDTDTTCAEESFYVDADGDGFGDLTSTPVTACEAPSGYALIAADCDDTDAAIFPGNTETCDGVDNTCDGQIDEGLLTAWYADDDNDGYGDPLTVLETCEVPTGYTDNDGDCDDSNSAISPGAPEVCGTGIDEDCDGLTDCDDEDCAEECIEDCTDKVDNDGDTLIDCDDEDCDEDEACVEEKEQKQAG